MNIFFKNSKAKQIQEEEVNLTQEFRHQEENRKGNLAEKKKSFLRNFNKLEQKDFTFLNQYVSYYSFPLSIDFLTQGVNNNNINK